MDIETVYSMKYDRSLITIERISEALKNKQAFYITLMMSYYLLGIDVNIKESIVERLRFYIAALLLRDKRGNNILHLITKSDVNPERVIIILQFLNLCGIRTNFVNHFGKSARDGCLNIYREYLSDKKRKRKLLRF